MLCRECGYRLWSLPSRQCPECGTDFAPSEFKFSPNSVRFCCPHCMQPYYGTDENGHLVPRSFPCASCQNAIDMDEMVLLPAEGIDEAQTPGQEVPWLLKGKGGFWKRWFSTIGWSLVRPQQLMRLMPPNETENSGWIFALFTVLMMTLLTLLPFQLLIFFMALGGGASAVFSILGTLCGALVLVPVIGAVVILLWATVTHAVLRVTGKTAYPLERTCQAICYSYGANMASTIPCIGWYFGWIWWLVCAVLMVKAGQQVGGWRASLATLLAPGLVVGIMIGFMGWGLSSGRIPNPFTNVATAAMTSDEVAVVAEAVVADADLHSGAPAAHAIELVERDMLVSDAFGGSFTFTFVHTIPVATGSSLQDFELMPDSRRLAIVQKLVAGLPSGTVAHRFGDFVFTYHGMDLTQADPRLWIVIWSPDPDLNVVLGETDWTAVGLADGTSTIPMQVGDFAAALLAQNVVRAAEGLPPLTDPFGVTHAKPEVAATTPSP